MATPESTIYLPPQHVIHWKPKSFIEVKYGHNKGGFEPFTLDLVVSPQIELAGSYNIWLNGRETTWTYDPEDSSADVITSLQIAFTEMGESGSFLVVSLGGTPNLYGADTAYRITSEIADNAKHFRLVIGPPTSLPPVQLFLQSAGDVTADLSGYLAKFDYVETVSTVDKSGINSRYEMLDEGRHSMAFNLTILSENDNISEYLMYDGAIGLMTIYEGDIVTGVKYGQFYAIIEEVKKSVTEAGTETTIRGRRMGAPTLPFGTIL